jgi:hypothetical protein
VIIRKKDKSGGRDCSLAAYIFRIINIFEKEAARKILINIIHPR